MKTITLLHTSDNMLPRSVRSYIDTCAHEFNQIDAWTKIAQIAYRIKRGVDLLPAFMEDIERHMKHPAYGDYEDGAKRSIATYIELLRTGDEYGMSTVSLPDNMSFPKIFQLLTEEILYRYWECEIGNGKVECIFDKVHYDYKEIVSRCKSSPNTKRKFINYISTSQETLRNINVDKNSIKQKNGWEQVADKMNDLTVWSDKEEDERIYPGDATFIHEFNKKKESTYQYVVGVPPMPFSGNLLNAKIIVLTLNPGYVEEVNKDICMGLKDEEKKQLLCLMRNALTLKGTGIYDEYEPSRKQGDYYWEKSFSELAMEAYGIPSNVNLHPIYEDIAFLQLIGYHSCKFRNSVGIKHIPSTIFLNLMVKYLVTKTDKTFLVLRSEKLWKEVFGEEIWNRLEHEGRIITKGHKGMSQKISRGNLKKDNGFDKLVKILKE